MNILEKAAAAVDGDRQNDYGNPIDNHATTGKLVDVWMGRFLTSGGLYSLTTAQRLAVETIAFNIMQKLSRLANSPDHIDSLVDLAGYARNWEKVLSDPIPFETTATFDGDDLPF